jgi:hypothetical protein
MNLSHWLAPVGFKSHVRVNVPFREYCRIHGVSKTWLNKFICNQPKGHLTNHQAEGIGRVIEEWPTNNNN